MAKPKTRNPLVTIVNFYHPQYAARLGSALQLKQYRAGAYYRWYLLSQDSEILNPLPRKSLSGRTTQLITLIVSLIAVQYILGIAIILKSITSHDAPIAYYGIALIVASPLVGGLFLPLIDVLSTMLTVIQEPKKLVKNLLCSILERQVSELRSLHNFTVISVSGSVGKTSTKLAIAEALKRVGNVQYQFGNYNDRLTVPLIFFGESLPTLWNAWAWQKIIRRNKKALKQPYPYAFVVVELGTDGPGQMESFAYLKPDLAVITAITEEHMEYFKTMETVAREELAVLRYAKEVLLNRDDIDADYASTASIHTYGFSDGTDYKVLNWKARGLEGTEVSYRLDSVTLKDMKLNLLGLQGVKIGLAAAAVAHMVGASKEEIRGSVASLTSFPGRMQSLEGIKHARLIDDTYNASPVAVKAGLDVLYGATDNQRIAILGSMNELGDYSKEAHEDVGAYCDPAQLDYVITIGKEAKQYLAPVAAANGCEVASFFSPYEAGHFVAMNIKEGAVVLAEGSQNGVFAEEALKELLLNPGDSDKLVRQSAYWQQVKNKQFIDHPAS